MRKKIIIISTSIVLILGIIVSSMFIFNEKYLVVTNYVYENEKINDDLDGLKILQISDWHSHGMDYDGTNIKDKIKEINPDLILLTGDFIDKGSDLTITAQLIPELKYYKTYYVNGNHEATAEEYYHFLDLLSENNVININDKKESLTIGSTSINILGLSDPRFRVEDSYTSIVDNGVDKNLQAIASDINDDLTILLSHRPELFYIYTKYKIDLVYSGHTHGGQVSFFNWRPFWSPNQGLFPYYSKGVYYDNEKTNKTTMITSSGVGNSSFGIRINNPFELTVTTLKKPS